MKLLIVDDSRSWTTFHDKVINDEFGDIIETVIANSATDGYSQAIQNIEAPFDMILTDLQMEMTYEPDLAGEWLIKNIKQLKVYEKTPIIIISSMYNIEFIAEKYSTDYIKKSNLIKNIDILSVKIKQFFPTLKTV